jgi:hypothetical protein
VIQGKPPHIFIVQGKKRSGWSYFLCWLLNCCHYGPPCYEYFCPCQCNALINMSLLLLSCRIFMFRSASSTSHFPRCVMPLHTLVVWYSGGTCQDGFVHSISMTLTWLTDEGGKYVHVQKGRRQISSWTRGSRAWPWPRLSPWMNDLAPPSDPWPISDLIKNEKKITRNPGDGKSSTQRICLSSACLSAARFRPWVSVHPVPVGAAPSEERRRTETCRAVSPRAASRHLRHGSGALCFYISVPSVTSV